jgi:hypothetical protein
MSDNTTPTADANAGAPMTDAGKAQADIVATDVDAQTSQADAVGASTDGLAEAMRDAQAAQEAAAADAVAARAMTDPSATYVRGVEGANVNVAAPKDAPVIRTYEDAQEAGYFGVAAGHANTDKLSVAAVTQRDRALGLPGTKGLSGAVVNGAEGDTKTAKGKAKSK